MIAFANRPISPSNSGRALAQRAEEELRAAGALPRRTAVSGRSSLTPYGKQVELPLRPTGVAIRPDGRSAAFHQTLLRTAERTSFSYRTRPGRAAYRFRLRRHDPAARPGTWTLHTSRAPRQTR